MARKHGVFVWNELLTTDVEKAKAFFGATLGWSFRERELDGHPYAVIWSGEEMVGGLGALETGDVETTQSYWLAFIEVTDIAERFATALEHGATAIRPPHDVEGIGRVCVLRDPTGAVIGWMQGT